MSNPTRIADSIDARIKKIVARNYWQYWFAHLRWGRRLKSFSY
jgi:lauroyl/myristoyl acyltransferase